MHIKIFNTVEEMGRASAERGAVVISEAIRQHGEATIIVATGASQFSVLESLTKDHSYIPWNKVTAFHLDEYVGLDDQHPASFCKYLKERFVSKVPLKGFTYINGMNPKPAEECQRLASLVSKLTYDVAFVGIGENGHLAFNDPPADFNTTNPYLVVQLDEACRKQQYGEGWFPTLEAVPKQAISMSIHEILRSKVIVCSVPDLRKAEAVRNSVEGEISPKVPASVLQNHPATYLHLDKPSASLLKNKIS